MREVSTERILKDIHRVIENPVWIPTLSTDVTYTRIHDDHDGTGEGQVTVSVDQMGDVWLDVDVTRFSLRFRTFGGGGRSLRTRNALLILAEAIRLDNENKPEYQSASCVKFKQPGHAPGEGVTP